MKEERNPFLLRSSEFIESDGSFVRYFGPGALDLLKGNEPFVTRFFLSAAGAGKTSLMRLFTPGPLLELHKHKEVEGFSELYLKMRGFGALGERGPNVLGVLLSCSHGYANLADIGLESAQEVRLLFALLDARLILATLRQALILHRLKFEEDLPRLTIGKPESSLTLPGLTLPCTGDVLHAWARKREDEICAILDSFTPEETSSTGSEGLSAFDLLRPTGFLVDGNPVAERVLLMLDDVQKLTSLQRDRLATYVLDKRSSTPVWIAERLEALSRDELLSLGVIEGRDYDPVYLECYWREFPKRFESVVSSIADRRVQGSESVEMFHFDPCLEDTLVGAPWDRRFEHAADVIQGRIKEKTAKMSLFGDWIAEREALDQPPRQRAVSWRELEILIERELRRKQASFDFALHKSELIEKSDSNLRAAAELFLANEFDFPYYFGSSTLAKLSSSNIQQYLGLAGQQFEEIISAALINPQQTPVLSAVRQEAILTKRCSDMWNEIPRRVAHGSKVKNLLEAIGSFSRWYTNRPTAPNDPGVNAVAISMSDRDRLLDPTWLRLHPEHRLLAEALASALSHNLLDAQPNSKCKGRLWLVLNLNRLLCVRYRLPLNYGKFKEQGLDELARWMEKGFDAKRRAGNEDDLL
ncbi:MAG: hypothetical protein ACK4UN_02195 [Limisphaerales bacterium]